MIRAPGHKVELIGPTSLVPTGLFRRGKRSREWDAVPVGDTGGTVGSVRLPRDLTRAGSLLFVSTVGGAGSHVPIALGVAARLAEPKWAALARLAGNRSPRLADLALALQPDWIVLTAEAP
ncbi:MAG: hypothetical protein M3R06_07595, partial [Chloroflexota bacterium]|nr:hypothetical protein [Chloroflexota bacterium]